MKKVIIFLTSVCLFCSLAVSTKVVKANSNDYFKGQTLTIYNVEDYISQGEEGYVDIIGNFEKEYGVKVNYYTYDTNETMYNQFTLQKEGTYDLICTSDYMIQKMIKEELVDPIDVSKIPNYEKYAAKTLREKLKAMNVPYEGRTVNLDEFAVGYMWGTLGIVYDPECSDTIREDVKSWDVFWNPTYKNVISIKNSIRDAFVAGLMHSYSKDIEFQKVMNAYLDDPNETNKLKYNALVQDIFDFKLDGSQASDLENKEKIARVKEELISMKKNIFGFEVDSGKNDIITGKIKLNLAYSGDAVYSINTAMEDADKVLEYYVPEDGSNIWYDAWTMPKGAKNKELAYEFLNYLSDPINAADNMDYIGYTPYIVGDELFTLTASWYGAADYDVNSYYSEETKVIYDNVLYECIKEKESENDVLPTNEEYFESCEYDSETTYEEDDMISFNGKIYNCLASTNLSPTEDVESWEEVEGYDLDFLFGNAGSFKEGLRRAVIYPFAGSQNQLETQYPSENIIARCAIMNDFGSYNDQVVIMWGQVKAYTNMLPVYIFLITFVVILIAITVYVLIKHHIVKNYKKSL